MERIHYSQWLTQKGRGKQVELIEFVGYYKPDKKYIRNYIHEGKKYIAEIWKYKYGNKIALGKFRTELEEDNEEVGWEYNKYPIPDNLPNPIVDSYERVEAYNKDKSLIEQDNFLLNLYDKKQQDINAQLKASRDKIDRARLEFRLNPCSATWRQLRRLRRPKNEERKEHLGAIFPTFE
jgi:hypothetical protein